MNTEEVILEIRLAVKKNGQYTVGKMMLMSIPHKEELKHFIKGLEEFATMSYFNGWFVRDDGDCECLYCGNIVKGFDFCFMSLFPTFQLCHIFYKFFGVLLFPHSLQMLDTNYGQNLHMT